MEQGKEIKWTKQRKRVREILEEATEPMSATTVFMALGSEEKQHYALSTIYRILNVFEEHNLVTKENWKDEQTALYEWNHGQHRHYAVCLECHKRIPLEECPFAHMHMPKKTSDFVVTDHKLEVYGYCKECNTKKGAK